MPLYAASISEMITMPVGVLTADYIGVWCNTATDTPHKIQVGDTLEWIFSLLGELLPICIEFLCFGACTVQRDGLLKRTFVS